MDALKEKRRVRRTDATKTTTTVDKNITNLGNPVKRQYLSKLETLFVDLKELDDKIFDRLVSTKASESDLDEEYSQADEYQNRIRASISILKCSLEKNVQDHTGDNLINKLKLPQLPLPKYGHKEDEDLTRFLTNFEQIINKYTLTEYEKFVYLQRQLTDEPLTLIKSLAVTEQTYESAKQLLEKAFANKVTQQYNAIQRLVKLKFTGDDCYNYISQVRQVIDSFKEQSITSDLVLQYFIWQSLTPSMKSQYIAITNNNKPTLAEIEEHIFTATDRYMSANNKAKSAAIKTVTTANISESDQAVKAATVNSSNKKLYCTLCAEEGKGEFSHATYACKKYPTVNSKLNRLKELKGCYKCAHVNHSTEKCRFRFKNKCRNCNKYHFSYLCPMEPQSKIIPKDKIDTSANKAKNTNQVTSSSVFVGNVELDQYGEDSILPTFSRRLPDGSVLRGLRDSGCQPNFITNEAAKRLKLKVIKTNFKLNVNGFNSTESMETDIVELKLDHNQPPIKAICVPRIKTKLKLPNLDKIVQGFIDKGYNICDEFLPYATDEITNLDFILGNNDAQVLPQTEVTFGVAPCSVYVKTPYGILLVGGIKRLLRNLPYLPKYKDNQQTQKTVKSDHIDRFTKSNENTSSIINNASSCEVSRFEVVIDSSNTIQDSNLDAALQEVISDKSLLNDYKSAYYDLEKYPEEKRNCDIKSTEYVTKNITRHDDGRLQVPLLWNSEVSHALANNFKLAKAVLKSNCKRLASEPNKLELYNDAIKSHLENNVIEKIENLPQYLREHPNASFLSHMGVFRMEHESTKCRIVLLSNLIENNSEGISHNQAMLSGENLNRKISTAITKLRFDRYLLCFDIVKAFLNIAIRPIDQEKLIILWYDQVQSKERAIVAYKYKRLPFGLRCSPTLLMLCLYTILITDHDSSSEEVKSLTRLIYDLTYMDNCAVTTNSKSALEKYYTMLNNIFNPYQMFLQQFFTNHSLLQTKINEHSNSEISEPVKLLGLKYSKLNDSLETEPLKLNLTACTKRQILSSIAANYDILQINGPILNRARLFMHKLQCSTHINWDDKLQEPELNEWKNICRQVNGKSSLSIDRFVGARNSSYTLIAFTDASMMMLGVVIYIKDLSTNKVTFLLAKNRLVNKQLENKSIPSLELHAVALGVETLIDTYEELNGEKSVVPINIQNLVLYSDSMVSLSWINSDVNKLAKMQKRSTFVMNRIDAIKRMCNRAKIYFKFVAGNDNPADMITRAISYNQLKDTCYLTGPSIIHKSNLEYESMDELAFEVPNPLSKFQSSCILHASTSQTADHTANVVDIVPSNLYSNFRKLVKVTEIVLKAVNKFKCKVKAKNPMKYEEIKCHNETTNFHQLALLEIIKREQAQRFPDVLKYLQAKNKTIQAMPNLVGQLNLFLDSSSIIRVRSKFKEWSANPSKEYPILLSKSSTLTDLIITDIHKNLCHSGIYPVLNQLRKQFFVSTVFSVVKRVLKKCLTCKRVHARTIKNNQSFYREFREKPPPIPFRYSFLDYFGPYMTKNKVKVWVLCITCLWSRAINLKLCYDMSVKEFLRAFQLHIFEYGLPEKVLSDLGSQLVAAGNVITDLMKDGECQDFFKEHNMQPILFDHYFKGNHSLGSLVESCVKQCKKLINGAIRNMILEKREFEFVIAQTTHLVNKRPIAFHESLRDTSLGTNSMPEAITPELLLKGYECPSMNIIPSEISDTDPEWVPERNDLPNIKCASEKLQKIRNRLTNMYNEEFLGNLLSQAVRVNDRYKPVTHNKVVPGDIVLLKEENIKPFKYPMGIVKETYSNELNEVTGVKVQKGNREIVKRHATSIIPYMSLSQDLEKSDKSEMKSAQCNKSGKVPKRKAAVASRAKTRAMLNEH